MIVTVRRREEVANGSPSPRVAAGANLAAERLIVEHAIRAASPLGKHRVLPVSAGAGLGLPPAVSDRRRAKRKRREPERVEEQRRFGTFLIFQADVVGAVNRVTTLVRVHGLDVIRVGVVHHQGAVFEPGAA